MSKALYSSGVRAITKGMSSLIKQNKNKKRKRDDSQSFGRQPTVTTNVLHVPLHQVWPDILKVKLHNQFNIVWTGVTGAVNGFIAAANALHNPLSDAGGAVISGANPLAIGAATSVYGLPQLLTLYTNYRIICTTCKTNTQNTSANLTDAAILYIIPLDPGQLTNFGNVNAVNSSTIGERPFVTRRYLAGQTMNTGITTRLCMSTSKQFGLRNEALLGANEYAGVTGTNPTNIWYWAFIWFPITAGTTSGTTLVNFEYDIEFFNRGTFTSGQA